MTGKRQVHAWFEDQAGHQRWLPHYPPPPQLPIHGRPGGWPREADCQQPFHLRRRTRDPKPRDPKGKAFGDCVVWNRLPLVSFRCHEPAFKRYGLIFGSKNQRVWQKWSQGWSSIHIILCSTTGKFRTSCLKILRYGKDKRCKDNDLCSFCLTYPLRMRSPSSAMVTSLN